MRYHRNHYLRCFLIFKIIAAFLYNYHPLWAAEKKVLNEASTSPRIFSTWEGFEADKCASIWLIKKFIDSKAQFKFFPKGELITEGIPFDTPDAELRRDQHQSTFESLAKKYTIKDSAIMEMGNIIYDIEVNVWGKKVYQESRKIEEDIRNIITSYKNNEEIIGKSDTYFEIMYTTLKNQKKDYGDKNLK